MKEALYSHKSALFSDWVFKNRTTTKRGEYLHA